MPFASDFDSGRFAEPVENRSETLSQTSDHHRQVLVRVTLHNCRFVVGQSDQQRRNPARYVVEHHLFKAVPGIPKPSGEDVDETQSPSGFSSINDWQVVAAHSANNGVLDGDCLGPDQALSHQGHLTEERHAFHNSQRKLLSGRRDSFQLQSA